MNWLKRLFHKHVWAVVIHNGDPAWFTEKGRTYVFLMCDCGETVILER